MLSKDTLANLQTISMENIDAGDVADTIVSPVDSPSSTVAVPAEPTPETQPVDIAMVVDTQNPTDMLGQAAQEATALQARADELLDMQHACEQYAKLIRQTGLEGISQEGAAFMQVGLKMVQKSLGSEFKVSNESFDTITPRSSKVKATISVEDIKEMASNAASKFKEIIQKLIALIKKGWEKFEDFGLSQDKKIDELLDRIKGIKNGGSLSTEITIKSPALLFADGVEAYPEVRQLTGLAHFALKAYPEALRVYYMGIDNWLRKMGDLDVNEEEIEAHIVHVAKPLEALADHGVTTQLFNGNYKIDISETGLSFGMTQGEGKEAPSEVVLPVEAPVKLRKTLTDLKTINALIIDYRAANDKIVKAAEKLANENPNKEATGVIEKVIKDSAPRNREIAEFISKVTRAYLGVIEQMIATHESASKA